MRELKGFELLSIEPGASVDVQFEISKEDLEFYTEKKIWEAEPGAFTVFIGTNSATKRYAAFTLR